MSQKAPTAKSFCRLFDGVRVFVDKPLRPAINNEPKVTGRTNASAIRKVTRSLRFDAITAKQPQKITSHRQRLQ
jgi:hypothetical protein